MRTKLKLYLSVILSAIILSSSTLSDKKEGCNRNELRIGTYNLRMDTPNDGKNAWPNRKEMVKGLIKFHDFDIFGTQEGFKHMLDGVSELDGYAYIGVGRDDGKDGGEHSAIFYKEDRFDLLNEGNFWLSETPDVPSKDWDVTCCNRICSWGKFYDKIRGKEFYFFNVHYDHQGKVARRESSKLLLSKIKQIAGQKATVFVTGDFNAIPTDEPITILSSDGLLKDSYTISEQPAYGTIGTANSFNIEGEMKSRIDYIWVTPETKVKKYGVLNDMQNGRFPSDHFPVLIQIEY